MPKLSDKRGDGIARGIAIGLPTSFAVLVVIIVVYTLLAGYSSVPEGTFELEDAHVSVKEPQKIEFSNEMAWINYELGWQDPAWDGEYPTGSRVKTAQYVNVKDKTWLTFQSEFNSWVAGILEVSCAQDTPATYNKAQELSDALGAHGFYIIRNYGSTDNNKCDRILFFFEEDANIPYMVINNEAVKSYVFTSTDYVNATYMQSDTFEDLAVNLRDRSASDTTAK